ncbi:unnamed protein product [Prorocentrum cordatum]|uniref:Uncharacterized protein n=1 Tax=Prorocentrum cordatum TaxID=2364126 RepID=A0ABN9V3B3_9DINO|nr:unnamed protein product [Polarella glacialis]
MPIKTMTAALTLAMTVATSAGVDTCRAHDGVTMMQLSAVSEASEKLVAPVSVSHAPPPTTRNRAMAKLRKELPHCPSPHPERGYLIARIKKNDPTGYYCSKWTGAFTATSASATCKADDAVINDMIALAGHENVVFKVVMDDEATLPRHYKFTSASQQYSSENIPMDDVCVSEYSPTGPWTCGKSSITDNSPVFCGLTTARYPGPYCQNSDPQVQALHPGYTGTDDGYKGYGHAWRFSDRCNNKHGSASMYEAYMMLKCTASEDCYDGSTCVGGFCIAAAPTPASTPAPTAPTPSPTPAPTAAPTTSPTSSPTTPAPTAAAPSPPSGAGAGASAVGDPHLQNIHGERFDLMRAGKHVLINIPRGTGADSALLRVQADARQLGGQCADMYFQQINVTGSWAEARKAGGLHYSVSQQDVKTPGWLGFGNVELKVVHGRTLGGLLYLNFYVKHLSRAGFAVGGLLGEDDHQEVSIPATSCAHRMALVAGGDSSD